MWICRMLFEVSRIKFVSEEWKILKIDIRMGFKIRYIKSDGRLICKVATMAKATKFVVMKNYHFPIQT